MVAALKVAHQEKRKRQAMRRELDELKGDFAKLRDGTLGCCIVKPSEQRVSNQGYLRHF